MIAPLQIDFYKASHHAMYPAGTKHLYSNFTPRSARLFKGSSLYDNKVVVFGIQAFVKDYLINEWNTTFFHKTPSEVLSIYKTFMDSTLGKGVVSTKHIEALHKLGYLPIALKALPEGERSPIGIPLVTVINTHPDFAWLVNYIESVMSAELWKPITTATIAYEYRRVFDRYADVTGAAKDFIPFQGHDFSFRGMSGRHDAAKSGMGHLTSFYGTDSCPAILAVKGYYNTDYTETLVGTSVAATEHSVMCTNIEFIKQAFDEQGYWEYQTKTGSTTKPMIDYMFDSTHTNTQRLAEIAYINYLITELHPTGIISVVADSFDFWYLMEYGVKVLKSIIEARDGKVVFRPDSGNPVDIICGTITKASSVLGEYPQPPSPSGKGAMECLYETFGYTTNDKGFKHLNPKVGLIYGDSITLERQEQILFKLSEKGYATDCIVLGIGSYTYQYITRDTLGFAMKATYTEIDGKPYNIYKDPKTSDGTKKSAKGLLLVLPKSKDNFELVEEADKQQEATGELQVVFTNSRLIKDDSFTAIRERLHPTK